MSSESANKTGSTAFTEDEQHVAGNAHNFFKAGQYDATLGILKKLQKMHTSDPRLMHNRALTEFCKTHQTKVSDFRKNLVKIQKMLQQSNKEDEDIVGSVEKNNYMTLHYNQALLLYNMHQYSDTENILEGLYENCDLTEDGFLLKICLLLADTHLLVHNPEKAGCVIANIEKVFLNLEEGNTNQKGANNEEKAKSTSLMSAAEAENLRLYLRYLKSRCYLQQKSIKACKREIKLLASSSASTSTVQRSFTPNVASVFLKSNFEFVRGNYHKAYKLLGGSPPTTTSGNSPNTAAFQDSVSTIYYNNLAVIHFNMGKYNLGALYMQKALHENDASVTAAVKQHHQTNGGGRHQQQSAQKSLSVLQTNKRYELLYNCGLQLLHAGKSVPAFECLVAVVPAFHSNPRLWLRLAECCVQKCTNCGMEEESAANGKSHKKSTSQSQLMYTTIGAGSQRKVIVNTIPTSIGGKTSNIATPAPTIEFASLCLNNALALLHQPVQKLETILEQNRSNGVKSEDQKSSSVIVQCHPGPPLRGDQLLHLYASVLTNSAFVSLQLGNTLLALHRAQTLLKLPKLSGSHRYLGNMYAAEALVSLDRISEAIQYLSIDKINSISCSLEENGKKSPTSDDGSQKSGTDNSSDQNSHKGFQRHRDVITPWHYPANVSYAHAYMIVNLSTSHCLRSEFEKAQRLLRQAASLLGGQRFPPQALLLAVYLGLNGGGSASDAIQLLHRNTLPLSPSQQALKGNGGLRAIAAVAAGNLLPNPGGSGGDSSASSTSSSGAGRSKPGTPQPGSGGITPERTTKGKEGKSKRNRR
uniref:CCR4-NOT transcription complex subunit 10 n=1 Tax=Phallusia mammillata TaxID=59560 RepID=A0A6F9DAG6_9ASCI|nr:CCR4-NOT transcription complex subunit 10 [Phallusia mammillata]